MCARPRSRRACKKRIRTDTDKNTFSADVACARAREFIRVLSADSRRTSRREGARGKSCFATRPRKNTKFSRRGLCARARAPGRQCNFARATRELLSFRIRRGSTREMRAASEMSIYFYRTGAQRGPRARNATHRFAGITGRERHLKCHAIV